MKKVLIPKDTLIENIYLPMNCRWHQFRKYMQEEFGLKVGWPVDRYFYECTIIDNEKYMVFVMRWG